MYFAEEATTAASNFSGFDPFVIAFTALIIIGLIRLLRAPKKKCICDRIRFGSLGDVWPNGRGDGAHLDGYHVVSLVSK